MKTIFSLLLLTASMGVVNAQEMAYEPVPMSDCLPPPAVVYQAPVVYMAPVVYQMPVVYQAPVYYAMSMNCIPMVACPTRPIPSTVTYIGGGNTGYQVSYGSCGSTVTYIGGSWYH
jgi:hypothetical protein